jgi:hypothetical protein
MPYQAFLKIEQFEEFHVQRLGESLQPLEPGAVDAALDVADGYRREADGGAESFL